MAMRTVRQEAKSAKLDHDRIRHYPTSKLRPAPENDLLYRPAQADDVEIRALAESVKSHGIIEPLVISRDGWILSGHRRHLAATLAGRATVPCRVVELRRNEDPDRFVAMLREYNRQREKSFNEKLREELVGMDPDEAYQSLLDDRRQRVDIDVAKMDLEPMRRRPVLSAAKRPLLEAVLAVLERLHDYWPLSDRQVHYNLLDKPPMIHASKANSIYGNDLRSYRALVDLLTRARLDGSVPWEAIADETRPVRVWGVHRDVRGFLHDELDGFLKGYWRDLVQSQPFHIEILVEKNTVASVLKPVAMEYCLPMTSGRGFCSLPPRRDLHQRFVASGKTALVILIASDFDPDGEQIAQSFARSLRDDFSVPKVQAVKVALTGEQVRTFRLPPVMMAKETSSNYKKFKERHGDHVFELEAIPPHELQRLLREAIEGVLDRRAFDAELAAERQDALQLQGTRRAVADTLRSVNGLGMESA
jgi:hypothetical protein